MSSAGHILDMINRMKQNKSLRNRPKFKESTREAIYSGKQSAVTEYNFPEVSVTELESLKIKIRKSASRSQRTSLFILLIMVTVVAVAFWVFIQYYKLG